MKGCLGVFGIVFVFIFAIALIGAVVNLSSGVSHANDGTSSATVSDSGAYRHKATMSVSMASRIVGNFPTGQDTDDYAKGLQHIENVHAKIGNYTIYQVIGEGRAIRQQQEAARDQQRQHAEQAAAAEREAVEAHLQHGEPDCLVLDDRSLTSESDEYTVYVKGTVKNTCSQDFSYVQVEISFYRQDGTLSNSGLANVNNLQAGDSWSFKTPSLDTDGGKFRIEKISGM